MEDQYLHILDDSRCLTRRQIFDYLEDKLSAEERYVVESHLNDCPFCSDALEGFAAEKGNEQTTKHHLNELYHHFIHNQDDKPRKNKLNPNGGWQKSSWYAAAAILVIAVGAFYLTGYIVKVTTPSREVAQTSQKEAASNLQQAPDGNTHVASSAVMDSGKQTTTAPSPKKELPEDKKKQLPTIEKPVAKQSLPSSSVINASQGFDTVPSAEPEMQSHEAAAREDLAVAPSTRQVSSAAPTAKYSAASKEKDEKKAADSAAAEKAEPAALTQTQIEYERGMNYYHKNDWKNAIINLSQVASKSNQLYYGAAKYYLAQSYKNAGDKLTATILLEQLAKENTPWKQAAQTALENIK
jgi:hypothetical protein